VLSKPLDLSARQETASPMHPPGGWKWLGEEQYYVTIQAADIDGDGKAELLGRTGKWDDTWVFSASH
jgi:hypothetical protein